MNHMAIAAVYLKPIDMEPKGIDPRTFTSRCAS